MKFFHLLIVIVFALSGCGNKTTHQQETGSYATDSIGTEEILTEQVWDYQAIYGHYTLESAAAGFSASLTIQPQGRDLLFTLVSRKGETCKGEAGNTVAMVNHNDRYHTGYAIDETCKLEFIFRHTENKIDVRELQLCTLHNPLCGFDGTYVKTKPS
jgi:hypothetical protein